jgi:trehalose 6-phosphate synthase/phosphatase
VKNGTVNKGAAANRLLHKTYDFVFAIGDDRTDEFMFRLLPKETISVKVGEEDTSARFYIEDTAKVREILRKF